jgi:hypothetical protein
MSRVSIGLLYTVILGVIVGMLLEVPYISGLPGALIVFALVYSFVVAKREVALMSYALDEQRGAERQAVDAENVVVPEWQQSAGCVPTAPATRFRQTTPEAPPPSPSPLQSNTSASQRLSA